MCYILYGAVNKEIDKDDYKQINGMSDFSFHPGTKHDVKMCILKDNCDYRITDWVCDCEFPFGMNNPDAEELKELEKLFKAFQKSKNIKYLIISKTWEGGRNKREETVNINEIDIIDFLANAKVNCLYQINFN